MKCQKYCTIYHVFTCSLGKVDCSHANNTIDGLIRAILYLPVVAVFLRQYLKKVESGHNRLLLKTDTNKIRYEHQYKEQLNSETHLQWQPKQPSKERISCMNGN